MIGTCIFIIVAAVYAQYVTPTGEWPSPDTWQIGVLLLIAGILTDIQTALYRLKK